MELAKKKQAVASIILKGDRIISEGTTTVYEELQPFRHAEINAIEKACKKLKTYDLTGCWLYTTYEPCPMCAAACVWARVKGVVYGARMTDQTPDYPQRIQVRCKKVFEAGTPKPQLHEYMREECKRLLR